MSAVNVECYKKNNFNNNICRNRNQIIHKSDQVTVNLSVDFIRFSIKSFYVNNVNFDKLFNELKRLSVGPSKYRWTNGRKYSESKKYMVKLNDKLYKVVAIRAPYHDSLPILITVHDIDKQFLLHFEPYLSQLNTSISWIEFTMDFITQKKDELYSFMLSNLMLKWPGKKYVGKSYKTTFYKNDLRGSETKGLRGYQKTLKDSKGNSVESVRIELLAKRKLLKKNGIETVVNVLASDSSIVIKYLIFKQFNYTLFTKQLVELGHDKDSIDQMNQKYQQAISNGYLYEANELAKIMPPEGTTRNFLNKHSFNQFFMFNISGLSFVNGDSFSFSFDKLIVA